MVRTLISLRKQQNANFMQHVSSKIGLQWALVGLCSVLFHSVGKWSLGANWLITVRGYPGFGSVSIPTPPWRDASPSQVTPPLFVRFPQQFAGTQLYSGVERGTVRVKYPAQEHNTVSLARAWTWTARSGDESTNHEATTPPPFSWSLFLKFSTWKLNCYKWEGNHCKGKGVTLKLETFYLW